MKRGNSFDQETLLSLTRLRDPIGIVSIYADGDPGRRASRRPGWEVAVKNELRALRRRARSEGPRQRWAALAGRLDALEPQLSLLLDPKEKGRGWAIFAPVADGAVRRVAVQLPLPDRVIFEETAFVRPLVAALDAGRPAGLATVSRSCVRTLEWRMGGAEEIERLGFDEVGGDWREMKGPAGANPARSQQSAPQRDRYERRVDDHRRRFLDSAGAWLSTLAADRGWDRLLVAGDARVTGSLSEILSPLDLELVLIDRALEGLAPHQLAMAVSSELGEANGRRDMALAERASDAALGGGLGALGLGEVLAALAEGRVGHLLLDQDCEYRGARAPDGRLVPDGEVAPGFAASDSTREPNLAERMIEQALGIGARVTPIEGEAAEILATNDGVAALLRW